MQTYDSKDNFNKTLPVPYISTLSSPQVSPFLHSCSHLPSICTLQDPHSQREITTAIQSSSSSGSPSDSVSDSVDPIDKEVHYITSSARLWTGAAAEGRSQSLSPYITPLPLPVKNCSSATSLTMYSITDKDYKNFFSVDTKGFLDKPPGAEDHRRHSIEICSSMNEDAFDLAAGEKRYHTARGPSMFMTRKKKMSPPCISVQPPLEAELLPSLSTMKNLSESMLLRRRTPSYELALQRDSLDLLDKHDPGQPLIKLERQHSHCGEYLSLPRYSFHQSDSRSMSSLARVWREKDLSVPSSCFDSGLEESTDFSTVNRTAQWRHRNILTNLVVHARHCGKFYCRAPIANIDSQSFSDITVV